MDRKTVVKDLEKLKQELTTILKYEEASFYQWGPVVYSEHGLGNRQGQRLQLNLGSIYTMSIYGKTMLEMIEDQKGYNRQIRILRHKEQYGYIWALDSIRFRDYVNPYKPEMSELSDGSDSWHMISGLFQVPKSEGGGSPVLTGEEILDRITALIMRNDYGGGQKSSVGKLNALLAKA